MCAESFKSSRRQINRRRVRKYRPFISIPHQNRQPSRVIQMSVRQHQIVDRPGINRQRLEIAIAQLGQSLKNPTIYQQPLACRLHQIFRTRNATSRTQKGKFCHRLSFS